MVLEGEIVALLQLHVPNFFFHFLNGRGRNLYSADNDESKIGADGVVRN